MRYWDEPFNPVVGCTPISEGCRNCYCLATLKRYNKPTHVRFDPKKLDKPLKTKKPTTFFVCNMSDLFHEAITDEQIQSVLDTMQDAPQHTYLILTKRAERLKDFQFRAYNIHIGVTVENKAQIPRIDHLIRSSAYRRWISVEPMLEPIYLSSRELYCIDTVIVGGESGPNRRPFKKVWAKAMKDACFDCHFYFKQGSALYSGQDRELNGRTYDDLPWKVRGAKEPICNEK